MMLAKMTVFLLLATLSLQAQYGESYTDTIKPWPLAKRTVFKKDTHSATIYFKDTLVNGELYLANIYWQSRGANACLVRDAQQHWITYEIHSTDINIDSIGEVDFNGQGKKELYVEYSRSSGHSHWHYGISEQYGGFLLIDLDAMAFILNEEDVLCNSGWENELKYEDENDPHSNFEIVGTTSYVEQGIILTAEVKKGSLTVKKKLADCSSLTSEATMLNHGEVVNHDLKPVHYQLYKENLLLKTQSK